MQRHTASTFRQGNLRPPPCIYSIMMNSIEWPKAILPEASSHVSLPELELTDADYAAASDALRNLDDCFFEVVFVHEVATRHCRERQLKAELARSQTSASKQHPQDQDHVKRWQTPTPIDQFVPLSEYNSDLVRAKK